MLLPWVPAIAAVRRPFIQAPSIWAYLRICRFLFLASSTSGLSGRIAAEITRVLAFSGICPARWPGPLTKWMDVLRRIRGAGKLLQLINVDTYMTLDLLDVVVNELGSGKGLIALIKAPVSEKEETMKRLAKYNIT